MKKIVGIFVSTLFISTAFSISVMAGEEENPEIKDVTGDAFGYIDIVSVWFYEKLDDSENLYISMKIFNSSRAKFQQTFAVFWSYKDVKYAISLHLGFSFNNWTKYSSGIFRSRDLGNNQINGTYDFNTGIITWMVPKVFIGNPEKGDVLTDTWSNAFRRVGFIGRIGFTRYMIDAIILRIFGNNMWDYAPERGTYGRDYVIVC